MIILRRRMCDSFIDNDNKCGRCCEQEMLKSWILHFIPSLFLLLK